MVKCGSAMLQGILLFLHAAASSSHSRHHHRASTRPSISLTDDGIQIRTNREELNYGSDAPPSDKYSGTKVDPTPIPTVTKYEPPVPACDMSEPMYTSNPVLQWLSQFLHSRYFVILRDFSMIGLLVGIWIQVWCGRKRGTSGLLLRLSHGPSLR